MKNFKIFIIRLIVSLFLAVIIGRFFFEGSQFVKTAALAAVMLFLAYLFEYTKKRDQGSDK
jgi:hypothetical protein